MPHLILWMTARGLLRQGFKDGCRRGAGCCNSIDVVEGRQQTWVEASVVDHCITDLTRVQQHVANIQDDYSSILASSALCLLEGHARRKQQKYKEEPADARSKRFEQEREKFALLAEMIREAGLPIADTINKLDDPKALRKDGCGCSQLVVRTH